MSDYIKRVRLCEQIESHKEEYIKMSMIYGFGFNEGANFIRKCISEVPSADVVEVVRCKDCKKADTKKCVFVSAKWGYTDDDFCSCGERKESE